MAEQTPAPSWPTGDDPGVPSHLIPEPPDGSRIEFESPGRDLHAARADSASSVAAGWAAGARWLYYGKTIPQTWEELMEDFGGVELSRFVFLTPAAPAVAAADSPAPSGVDPGEAAACRVGYETGRDAGIAEGRTLSGVERAAIYETGRKDGITEGRSQAAEDIHAQALLRAPRGVVRRWLLAASRFANPAGPERAAKALNEHVAKRLAPAPSPAGDSQPGVLDG